MTKVYIVEGCRVSVKPLIKETEKSFIVEMRGAHNGRYAQPKRRHSQYINAMHVQYANTDIATKCPIFARDHLRAQIQEVRGHHRRRLDAAERSFAVGLEMLSHE